MWSTEIDFTISRQVYVFRVCTSTYMYRLRKFSTYQQLPTLYISIFIFLCSLAETSWKNLKPMCVLGGMSHFSLKRHNCRVKTNCLFLKMGCWHILLSVCNVTLLCFHQAILHCFKTSYDIFKPIFYFMIIRSFTKL